MNDLLEALRYKSEGDSFDVKSEQYKFANLPEDKKEALKSELLKDVLAMANSWSTEDRYIVLGASEQKPPPHSYIGIEAGLIDDAQVQEFINKKLNRPMSFSYEEVDYNGDTIGLFKIPNQQRPFYAERKYGKVDANAVYVRRGSSTDIASPDEISRMGVPATVSTKPKIDVALSWDDVDWKLNSLDKTIKLPEYDDDVLQLGKPAVVDMGRSTQLVKHARISALSAGINHKYPKLAREYLTRKRAIHEIHVRIFNNERIKLNNLSLRLEFRDSTDNYKLLEDYQLPTVPTKTYNRYPEGIRAMPSTSLTNRIIVFADQNDPYAVTEGKNIQARTGKRFSNSINIEFLKSSKFTCEITIFGDDLEEPISREFEFDVELTTEPMNIETFKKIAHID